MNKGILQINPKKVFEKIVNFLKKEFEKRNKTKAILGLSGGIDSTTCAILIQKAGLDLYGVILPYRGRNKKESEKVVKFLNLSKKRFIISDIALPVDAQIKELRKVTKLDRVDKGNIMARQRMIFQYALARSLGGLVVGTENLSEYYLGYFTLHGDQACDISPIVGLFKTQVYDLAKYLGVPQWIIDKPITAGLWPTQTDEAELGFSYKEADPILYLACIKKYSKQEIIKKGFSPTLVNKVLERVWATEFKRQSPPKFLFN